MGLAMIEDYALIGDCETAALVGRDGSIDWLCWPRFDSPACFAALLGDNGHGRWIIAAVDPGARVTRRYRPDTLILETRFETADGGVTVIDFMPPRETASDLVRIVRADSGRVPLRTELVLRFGYGAATPWVSRLPDDTLRAIAGPDLTVLRTTVPLHGEDLRTVGEFVVEPGEQVAFVLSYGPSHLEPPRPIDPYAALADTEAFWREWVSRGDIAGPYAAAITRSLITLKALTYAPTGGVVAAPTTSLPEEPGGERNWDYRYCWVRDATLTLLSLMNAGYYDEARAWRDWLVRAVAGNPDQLQIMYGIAGERRLLEWTADWLPGHGGARPVRIGNAAFDQLQLDVYGELMDALCQARRGGLPDSLESWALQRALIGHLATIWDQPDEGLWETRGGRKQFVFSKVMAWVAIDRAIEEAERYALQADVSAWCQLRSTIHETVCREGFDREKNSFVSAFGETTVDASLLLLAEVGFLAADDPRFLGTVAAVERELLRDGFLLRYDTARTDDGLAPGEGAFLVCTCWLADAWVLIGRHAEAEALFERILGVCNDLGLLAEEVDPQTHRLCGNFPQAFSHVGLINTAFNLSRAARPVAQRCERP